MASSRRKMSGRSSARSSRSRQNRATEADDPANYNVRFDYSDTYLDNEDLETRLEDQADEIYREKYRMCVETDDLLKKAKQDADERLQLKNKVKNRDPNESSERVLKSADLKRRPSNNSLIRRRKLSVQSERVKMKTLNDKDEVDSNEKASDKTSDINDETLETEDKPNRVSKPLNTLTMFLLSIQNLKRPTTQQRRLDKESKGDTINPKETGMKTKPQVQKSSSVLFLKRPASYQYGDKGKRDTSQHGGENEADGKSQYGMHVKKDFTRSRRALEEISKLEQDSKYGYVNRYEERRKMLLAECKDTKSLQDRIKFFLRDVDEFKMMTSNENSLERVLMRAKSARLPRASTFAW